MRTLGLGGLKCLAQVQSLNMAACDSNPGLSVLLFPAPSLPHLLGSLRPSSAARPWSWQRAVFSMPAAQHGAGLGGGLALSPSLPCHSQENWAELAVEKVTGPRLPLSHVGGGPIFPCFAPWEIDYPHGPTCPSPCFHTGVLQLGSPSYRASGCGHVTDFGCWDSSQLGASGSQEKCSPGRLPLSGELSRASLLGDESVLGEQSWAISGKAFLDQPGSDGSTREMRAR